MPRTKQAVKQQQEDGTLNKHHGSRPTVRKATLRDKRKQQRKNRNG